MYSTLGIQDSGDCTSAAHQASASQGALQTEGEDNTPSEASCAAAVAAYEHVLLNHTTSTPVHFG